MKTIKTFNLLLAITVPAFAHANFVPNKNCSLMAVEKTIQFASMHGFSECRPHGMPYFDTNKGPLSGLVSVELACSGENQLQINMNYRGDRAGNCIVSNPRFWNP